MGSTSPGLSSMPPSAVFRTGPEKVTAGAVGPERRDWSPSPPATPEQGLSAFYLSYFDMLYPEDSGWATKGPGESTQDEVPEEPEQCPVIDSQAPGGSLDLAPGGLTLEEHSLEQVQSMVVGEVLKDIETACKLLNITAGEPLHPPPKAGGGQGWGLGAGTLPAHSGLPRRSPRHVVLLHIWSVGSEHSNCELELGRFHPLCAPRYQPGVPTG